MIGKSKQGYEATSLKCWFQKKFWKPLQIFRRLFLPLIGISGWLTCQALLVFHLCRFQQLQHLHYWHNHLLWHHLLSAGTSLRLPHSFLTYSATKGWTVKVAMDWKFQLNIVFMVKKRLPNGWPKKIEIVKKELQYKISKCLK